MKMCLFCARLLNRSFYEQRLLLKWGLINITDEYQMKNKPTSFKSNSMHLFHYNIDFCIGK